jgi:deoxyribose-phosphate aldolase
MSNSLAAKIDHTLLKADATEQELTKLCEEAKECGFATVCVNSSRVLFCAKLLKKLKAKTKAIAVVGFPLGAMSTKAKVFETKQAIKDGAAEIDMVIAIGQLKDKQYEYVLNDIRSVVKAAGKRKVKVILETALLDAEEKRIACSLAVEAGAAFVKTCTGFGGGGATEADIQLMRATVGKNAQVKASGGIRTHKDALKMLNAGADRIGASASVAIVKQENAGSSSY